MVVMDQWGSLWGNVFSAATRSWYGWRQSGGGLVGSPAIAVDANGTAWVVVRSSFNALWLTSLAPVGFGNWTSLGGIVNGDPAIAAPSAGMAYIISRDGAGDTGGVWLVRAFNGVSQGWSFLGGVIRGNPAVVAGLNGTAHVIALDPNSYPWVAIINGTTANLQGSTTAVDSAPSGIHVDNVVTLVAIRSGQVWSAAFSVATQGWGAWASLGQAATSCSAANSDTSLAVAARDPAGQLVWYRAGVGWANYGTNFAGSALSAAPTGFTLPTTTITSTPAGLTLTVDGLNCTAPCTFQWFPGSSHTIAAPTSQQFQGSTYWFSFWSDKQGQSHTVTAPAQTQTIAATMVAGTNPLVGTTYCLGNTPTPGLCTVPPGVHSVTSTLTIRRSGITLAGGSTDRNQTVLVRAPAHTGPMMLVDVPRPATSIGIQNLTFCGGSTLSTPAAPCPSPAQQTTCGTWQQETDWARRNGQPDPLGKPICTDLIVTNADKRAPNAPYPSADPFGSNPGDYSLTIANCGFEGSTVSVRRTHLEAPGDGC